MDFTSKLSLYDFLAILLSGFLILALFIPNLALEICNDKVSVLFIAGVSYLLGLVYIRILEFVLGKCCKKKECCMLEFIKTAFYRNYEKTIVHYRNCVFNVKENNVKCGENEEESVNMQEYYAAYYSIMDKPCYSNIVTLESQYAFLRNILPLVIIHTIVLICEEYSFIYTTIEQFIHIEHRLCVWIFFVVVILGIVFAMHKTQTKIYYLVWHGCKYHK